MSFLIIALFTIVLFVLELAYFKVANYFNIIDAPNHRSSHTQITLRGGGILFPIAVLLWYTFYGFNYSYFFIGLMAIALISFLDDILTLNNKIRLTIHLTAVLLMFFQWGLFDLSWLWLIVATIFVIGTINAYNFMDGINGITGSYSLLTAVTLWFINNYQVSFISNTLLIVVMLSLLVFNFFNFRTKAKCFAGDVGSVSIAYILIFIIGQLILKTENFTYILLLMLYGLDTVTTVIFRKIRKENIFKAHRSHFYQYLVNHKKMSHLSVSFVYFCSQAVVSAITLFFINGSIIGAIVLFSLSILIFLSLRFSLEGKELLIGKK